MAVYSLENGNSTNGWMMGAGGPPMRCLNWARTGLSGARVGNYPGLPGNKQKTDHIKICIFILLLCDFPDKVFL